MGVFPYPFCPPDSRGEFLQGVGTWGKQCTDIIFQFHAVTKENVFINENSMLSSFFQDSLEGESDVPRLEVSVDFFTQKGDNSSSHLNFVFPWKVLGIQNNLAFWSQI